MPTLSDITPPPSGSPGGHPRASLSSQAQQLLAELQVRAGTRFDATVTRLSSVSSGERQTLLQSLAERSPQLSPDARQAVARLLGSPTLQLVQLEARAKPVHTLTDLPLVKGQVLTVQVRPDGQLQLLPPGPRLSSAPQPIVETTPGANQTAQSASSHPLRHPAATVPIPNSAALNRVDASVTLGVPSPLGPESSLRIEQTQVRDALRDAMRQALPQAQPTALLLNKLAQIPQSTLEALIQSSPLLRNVLTPLVQLSQQISTLNQWRQDPTHALKNAMQENGVFLEQKLREQPAKAAESVLQDHKSLLGQALQALLGQPPAQTISPKQLHRALSQFELAVARLFGGANTQQASAAVQAQALPRLVQSALAQIQLQQYRTLGAMAAEPAPLPAHLYLDIPLRLPEGYWNVFLHLQEFREKEEKTERKSSRRKSRWRVFMELEMESEGTLAMEVNLLDQKVDIRFWAERTPLRKKTEAGLAQLRQNLEAQGLQVTDLRCSDQPPPAQKVALDYSLVDERT